MTYADKLKRENIESNILVVVKPRRIVSAWTLVSGSLWYAPFDYGVCRSLFDDASNEAKSESTTYPPATDKWYYNTTEKRIYYAYSSVTHGVPLASNTITATYELYSATADMIAPRVPPGAGDQAFFESTLMNPPTVNAEVEDVLMGFVNTSSSAVTLNNASHWLEKHIYDGSFNQIDVNLYHALGINNEAAYSLLYAAVCTGITWNQDSVTLALRDRNMKLAKEFRSELSESWTPLTPPSAISYAYRDDSSFFTLAKFSGIDPAMVNRPMRTIYGKVNGVVPVNVNYNDTAPSSTNNRKWYVGRGNGNSANKIMNYVSQTSGKVKVNDITGIEVGDTCCIHTDGDYPPSVVPGYGFQVTALYPSTNELGHSGTTLSIPGGTVKVRRSGVSAVYWMGADNNINTLIDGIHYHYYEAFTYGNYRVNGFGFRLHNDFESEIYNDVGGGRITLRASDRIWCTAYGEDSWFSVGSTAAPTATNGCVDNGVAMIYELLTKAGITASEIDTTTFNSLIGTLTQPCGFAVPSLVNQDYPRIREIIGNLLKSLELRLYVNTLGKWTLRQIGPTGTPDYTISDLDIKSGSINSTFDYSDVKTVVHVGYDGREVSEKGGQQEWKYKDTSSTTARNLHATQAEYSHDTVLKASADAEALSEHLAYAMGDRTATTRASVGHEFIQAEIGDVVTVSREKLPGFEFAEGTDRTRDMVVIGTSKSIDGIELTLDDQKGIEDNEGSW
jgi:hypothetical protein